MSQPPSPAQIAKAERLLADVAAGRTVFTRTGAGDWMIVGPAADVVEGARVAVTRKDGSTAEVIVGRLGAAGEKRGTAYQVATFTNAPAAGVPAPRHARAEAPATPEQIDTILRLVAQRLRDGNDAGFMPVRAYTREQLVGWTSSAASQYITSLREDY